MDPDRTINPPQNPLPDSDPQNQTSTPSFSPISQETTPPTVWSSDLNPPLVSQTSNQTSRPQPVIPESISQPMYQETPPMPPLPITKVPSSSSSSGFLRIFFIGIALILFGILIGVLAARFLPMPSAEVPVVTPTPIITITPSLTPEVTPVSTASANFICPANGWVDCMPILDESKTISCSTEAMNWYKVNCPNFQGAAL